MWGKNRRDHHRLIDDLKSYWWKNIYLLCQHCAIQKFVQKCLNIFFGLVCVNVNDWRHQWNRRDRSGSLLGLTVRDQIRKDRTHNIVNQHLSTFQHIRKRLSSGLQLSCTENALIVLKEFVLKIFRNIAFSCRCSKISVATRRSNPSVYCSLNFDARDLPYSSFEVLFPKHFRGITG